MRVAVTYRVLGLARQPSHRWLARSATDAELTEAYQANALFDAHRDDPEFGHRFLLDEAHAGGEAMAERTAWRICQDNGWWSAFGKRRRRGDQLGIHLNRGCKAANRFGIAGMKEVSSQRPSPAASPARAPPSKSGYAGATEGSSISCPV
ncbi:integrase catalytic subunit [Streptomyces lincolnensis]|uniref:Integrase catalytic subunit n=1 Tax=Streptomyces lincolnensis TaxID=1915 RepID=A0A1B1MPH7_STRLN|nr:integrase catalytic subunit [Streptomyces lincolnensis]